MKKSFVTKTFALFIALIMAFSISASAVQGYAAADAPVEIRQYEIVTFEQLLAGTGYTNSDINYSSIYCFDAMEFTYRSFYGEEVGEGSISLVMNDNTPFNFKFNVVENPDLLARDITLSNKAYTETIIPMEETLKDLGYTLNDVRAYDYTGENIRSDSMQFYATRDGKGQIIFNMNDGKILLIEVTVEDAPKTISDIVFIFFLPIIGPLLAIIAPAFLWPFILTPFFTPIIWGYGIAELIKTLAN